MKDLVHPMRRADLDHTPQERLQSLRHFRTQDPLAGTEGRLQDGVIRGVRGEAQPLQDPLL